MSETKTARSFANPVLQRLQNAVRQELTSTTATYSGIAAKTAFFLVMAIIGAALFICLHPIWLASGNALDMVAEGIMVQITVAELIIAGIALLILFISPFIALFNQRLLAVVGTLYCLCEGYLIAWTSIFLTPDMQWIPWCALALTILIAAVMLVLYTTGIARVGHRFRSFLMVVILTTIFGSLLVYVGTWIPGVRNVLLPIVQDPLTGFIMSIVFVIIASLFLLSDFNMVQTTVENGLPKQYEWTAAYGLAYSLIWLYLKVLDLLLRANSRKN